MNRKRRKLLFLLVTLLLLGSIPVWLTRAIRQENLNRDLIAAVQKDDLSAIRTLVHQGADMNAHTKSTVNLTLWTLLHDWLHGKAGRDESDKSVLIALHVAIDLYKSNETSLDTVKTLLDLGADVELPDARGATALVRAVEGANYDLIQLLLDRGAKVNGRSGHDETPLIVAVGRADAHSVKILLKHGADVNVQDFSGLTPLMLAVIASDVQKVKLLLEYKSNLTIKDNGHRTALKFATTWTHLRNAK